MTKIFDLFNVLNKTSLVNAYIFADSSKIIKRARLFKKCLDINAGGLDLAGFHNFPFPNYKEKTLLRRKGSFLILLTIILFGSAAFGAMALINREELAGYLPTILQSADSKFLIAEAKDADNAPVKNDSSAVKTNQDSIQTSPKIPTQITYLFLFKRVDNLDKKAADEEAKGKDGKIYRQHYKDKAKLTDTQNDALFKVAKDCLKDVSKIDDEARKIIDKDYAKYPGGKIKAGDPIPTPPIELTTLKLERDATVLRYLDVLKTSFSPTDFLKFQQFVEQDITAQVSTTTLTKDLRPVFSPAESAKQMAPDTAINPRAGQSEEQK